jgi:hypothetical protein
MNATTTADDADESTIAIEYVDSETALYHRYPRETSPQDCYVELDAETGALSASYNPEIGGAVPAREYHGHVQSWKIPALRASTANALLDELAPLCERVCAGYRSAWNGSNHVAKFDADAADAIEEISALIEGRSFDERECVQVWDAGDWYGATGSRDQQRKVLGITAATTDAELEALATRESERASSDGVDEIEGLDRYLERLRDDAVSVLVEAVAEASAYEYGDAHLSARVRARLAAGEPADATAMAAAIDAEDE